MAPNRYRVFLAVTGCLLVDSLAADVGTGSLPIGSGFGEVQAQLRWQVDWHQFKTSFTNIASSTSSPGGSAQYVQGNNNAALYTLSGNGVASGVVTLEACGIFAPHYHPRANEVIVVANGNLSIAFSEENQIDVNGTKFGGRVLGFNVVKGEALTVPQGLLHYIYNNNSCSQAQVVTAFDNRDPGTVSIVQQLFQLPDSVVSAATGLDLIAVTLARKTSNGLNLIGIDTECQKACNGASAPAPPSDGNILKSTGSTGSGPSTSTNASTPPIAPTAGRKSM